MNLKIYTIFVAIGNAILAIFALSLLILEWDKVDAFRLFLALTLGSIFAFFSYRQFKKIKEIREEEQAFAPPLDATVEEKIKYCRNMIYLSLVAFPFVSIMIILDLNKLESGSVEHVRIWAPVAFVYEQLGYWPGILFVPVLGVFVIFVMARKMRQLKSEGMT
ncbi:hypothetical protein [Leptospira neocaledonica]|uniref:Uncharacterized protein n=1 Tax=Leptospira neocaledonica TaxID=2023192 RepID=A0A2M9ZW66_9LEPT|nr:hypothetical protein [Leptospira neocaledonica]PJZ76316.1 hypothetical protein CH365_13050 [Leptospira neocaledonica]